MATDFNEVKSAAERSFGGAFTLLDERVFALTLDGISVTFAEIPGDPAMVLIRTRVVDTKGIARRGALAVAALAFRL